MRKNTIARKKKGKKEDQHHDGEGFCFVIPLRGGEIENPNGAHIAGENGQYEHTYLINVFQAPI